MRHRKAGWKLGRNTSHRRALLRNLVTSLILEDRIETTETKAKAMRPHVEKMITLGKRGDAHAKRQAGAYLMTGESVERLFDKVRSEERRVGKECRCRWSQNGVNMKVREQSVALRY